MEAIKTKAVARDGILSVPVPKEFEEKELEVIVLSTTNATDNEDRLEELQRHEAKVDRLMSIVGAAKYPDFAISKYDVYEQ